MFQVFEADSADDLWQMLGASFREGKRVSMQGGRGGETVEMLHAALSINDPRQRWVVSRYPAINPAFAIAEVVWIVQGRNDSSFLNYFNRSLCKFAGYGSSYHGAYGFRLRYGQGLDQLERAYRVLLASPSSRQVILQIWSPTLDLPNEFGVEAAPDVPCNIAALLKIREGKLEWTQVMRSNDLYRGFPYNVVQFTTLQEVMAGWLGVGLGSYNHLSDSLHVYKDCMDYICEPRFACPVRNEDSLALPKEESEIAFRELERGISYVIDESFSAEELVGMLRGFSVPKAFLNMLWVVCAEGIRRRGREELMADAIQECSSAVLRQLWERWLGRVGVRDPRRSSKEDGIRDLTLGAGF